MSSLTEEPAIMSSKLEDVTSPEDDTIDLGDVQGFMKQALSSPETQSIFQRIKDFVNDQRKEVVGMSEFLKPPVAPKNAGEAFSRLTHNVSRFHANYMLMAMTLGAYTLLTSPILLIAIAFMFFGLAWAKMRRDSGPVTIMGRELTSADIYKATLLISIPLLWLTGATSAIFWVIGISISLVFIHAVLSPIPTSQQLQASA
eukprot:m.79693 g.79693  ORF g.79693 m.79693 type:complete len:201 (+) comp12576_c0_seq1:500-1102(+)